MQIGMAVSYSGGFAQTAQQVGDLERAGADLAFVPEAYSFDAVSQLGFLAARTERIQLASGILQIYTRTPTLTAMTAAGLDYVSDGRFTLGLGASGPQVIEGFHGVRYDAPLGRTREIIDICRKVWRRERLEHEGRYYHIPLTEAEGGSGLGKPLKLINHPVRERIPIMLASIGPKNVALTAELAEVWQPIFFHPDRAQAAFGDALAEGGAKRDPALGPLQICIGLPIAITRSDSETTQLIDAVRGHYALYIGGMGARGKNFYNTLAQTYGYAQEAARIQDLYLAGEKAAAAAAVPEDLIRDTALIGPESYLRERVEVFAAAGVTTLAVIPLTDDSAEQVALVERVRNLID